MTKEKTGNLWEEVRAGLLVFSQPKSGESGAMSVLASNTGSSLAHENELISLGNPVYKSSAVSGRC